MPGAPISDDRVADDSIARKPLPGGCPVQLWPVELASGLRVVEPPAHGDLFAWAASRPAQGTQLKLFDSAGGVGDDDDGHGRTTPRG